SGAAHPARMTRDTAGEILGRVVEQEQVDASVLVVVEEGGVGSEAGVGDSVLRRRLGECSILVIDEKEICPVLRLRPGGTGDRDVDVEVAIVVYIDHRHAGRPSVGGDARGLSDVLEAHSAFVEIQAAGDHVAGEENIRQAIVVDVAHPNARSVVHVDVGLDVQRVAGGYRVLELDTGLVGTQQPENGSVAFSRPATGQQEGNQKREPPQVLRPQSPQGIFSHEPKAADFS